MNWTATQLRNELKKQKEAYENRLNLLTNASLDAQNYLTLEAEKKHLEEQLNQTQTNLQNTQQSITNLQTEIQAKEQNIIQLKSKLQVLQSKQKEHVFNLQKQLRDYWFYHQREIKRLAPDLKAKLANLKEQKGQLLTNITNLESNLEQKSEELARSLKKEQKNKTEILALKTELDSINLLLEKAKEEFKKANSKIKELQKDKKKLSEQAQSKEAELLNQIQGLNIQNTNLTKQSAALKILAEKRKADLAQEKQALIALAKKKIQNKKETSQLLEQLQASWTEEKQTMLAEHEQTKESLIQNHQAEQTKLNNRIEQLESTISALSFNLAFKESITTDLTARINTLQTTLQHLLTEQEAQLANLDN